MKQTVVSLALLFILYNGAPATPLLYRTGTTLKPLQVNAWVNFYYGKTVKGFSWADSQYYPLPESLRTSVLGAEVMAAAGLPFKTELGLVAPVSSRKKGDNSAAGLGDVMVTLRHGLLQSGLMPVKLAWGLATNLPTAQEGANPSLGDRTFDVALGLWANTMKLGMVVGHLRAGYWFNGKTSDGVKVGNMLEYLVNLDLALPGMFTPQLAFSGYSQSPDQHGGSAHQRWYNAATVLLLCRPVPMLVLRPKATFPLASMSRGGALADYILGLDVWATVP
ncbi:MAG: hypothetical protein ABIK44_00505 [candidate division WOR-3 bacterium]